MTLSASKNLFDSNFGRASAVAGLSAALFVVLLTVMGVQWQGALVASVLAAGFNFALVLLVALRTGDRGDEAGSHAREAEQDTSRFLAEYLRLLKAEEVAQIGSWELDHVSGRLDWTPQVYRMFGVDPAHFTPSYESFLEWVHPEDRPAVDEAYRKSVETRKPYSIVHRIKTGEPGTRWLWEQGTTEFNPDGSPRVSRGTVQDVTENQKMRESLSRSEGTLKSILRNSPEGIIVADARGIVRMFSNGAEDIFKCRREAIIGQPIQQLIPERYRSEHEGHFAHFATSNRTSLRMSERSPISGLRADGEEFPAEVSISKVEADGETVLTATVRDISERTAYERALKDAKTAAQAANEAKSAFLATMSHEIRTPMNGILGMLTLLQDAELAAPHKRMASIALDSANVLMGQLNDILDFSRIEAGRIEIEQAEVDLRAVIGKVCDVHEARAREAGLGLSWDVPEDLPARLTGDPARIGQVLHNLVGNAIKFT